jgi:TPR repeat protein
MNPDLIRLIEQYPDVFNGWKIVEVPDDAVRAGAVSLKDCDGAEDLSVDHQKTAIFLKNEELSKKIAALTKAINAGVSHLQLKNILERNEHEDGVKAKRELRNEDVEAKPKLPNEHDALEWCGQTHYLSVPNYFHNVAHGMFYIGNVYLSGKGVQQNKAKAANWFRQAAEEGDADAQAELGYMYDRGEGVPQNKAEAVKWYRRAAEQGHAKAQNNLGIMYMKGEDVAQDKAEAVKLWKQAAEQRCVAAQSNLGKMYNLAQDKDKAKHWYKLAAEQGDPKAQSILEGMK